MRFVLVSFAFLAYAFYELSGGADFQPPVRPGSPESKTEQVTVVTPAKPSPAKPNPARPQPVTASSLVASPAIAPVKKTAVTPEQPALADETDYQSAANLDRVRTSLGQGLALFPDSNQTAQPLMLASLEQGATGITTAPPVENATPDPVIATPPPADIREISGTRVNMRDGPGTIYPVIKRMTLGQQVEVLGGSGTGWLRLRTVPDQTIGWISASLVSKAAQ